MKWMILILMIILMILNVNVRRENYYNKKYKI